MAKKKKTYEPAPEIPPERAALVEAILQVKAGTLSVSDAAAKVGMSRVHFQTLMHRGIRGLVEGVSAKPPGRPGPSREAQLEEELQLARREIARLKTGQEISERLMKLAGEVIRGETTLKLKKVAKDEDPGQRLAAARDMRSLGMKADLAAGLVGASPATLRRWASRERRGHALLEKRGPAPAGALAPEQRGLLEGLVRATHGTIGADALRHAVPGTSRRPVAAMKRELCTRMERERKEACTRIQVLVPGVMRGFDAIEARAPATWGYILRCADAAVPFTTSLPVVPRYDAATVVEAVLRDWERHGAPLVLRLDRAAVHMVETLRDVADAHGVLLLHGPAYYPCFYGQHERGNRDVRVLFEREAPAGPAEAAVYSKKVQAVLNDLWPRRSLGYRTPAQLWRDRPGLRVDRCALRAEVADRAERLQYVRGVRGGPADLTERLAIEQVLMSRGWLRRETGGRC